MLFRRIAFVAYEPWETRLGHQFLHQLNSVDTTIRGLLLVADPFQIRNRRGSRRLQAISRDGNHNTGVVFEDLLSWQQAIPTARPEAVSRRLEVIARNAGLESIDELISSDVHLVPRERSPFYYPLDEESRRAAALFPLEKTLGLINEFDPDVIVMMWDQYLVKNFLGRLADAQNIPLRVFRRVRYQDYLKLDYFFFPSETNSVKSLRAREPVPGLTDKLDSYGTSLYEANLAIQLEPFVSQCRNDPRRAVARALSKAWRQQLKKLSTGPLSRPRKFRRLRYWSSHYVRVHLYLALKLGRTLRYIADQKTLTQLKDLPKRFILVPLHFRPESAILTQGRGVEDDDVVTEVARALSTVDPSVTCVILEHPAMIEDRRYSFYRKLIALGNVVIADPVISTQVLLDKSIGVVTISGTVALEASLALRPVHVVGYPEFRTAINSVGWGAISEFVAACIAGQAPHSRDSVVRYIVDHCDDSWRGELGWSAIRDKETQRRTVNTLVTMFTESQRDLQSQPARKI